LDATVNKRNNPQAVGWTGFFIAAFEEVGHEALDALSAPSFGQGHIARDGKARGEEDDQADYTRDGQG